MPLTTGPASSSHPSTTKGFVQEGRRLAERLGDGAISVATYLEHCTRLTTVAMECSRTGIWLFMDTADGRVLRCLALYDSTVDRMESTLGEWRDVEPYFAALEHDGFVSTSNASTDPATVGLIGERLLGKGIRSLLATSCSINGQLYGAFTCTQVGGTREWSGQQLALLRQISAPASLALYRASRFTATTGYGPLLE